MSNDSTTRIVRALRTWIDGAPAGAQLPTTRTIAAQHGASPVTVQKAIRQLVALGLVESRPGAGSFVLRRGLPRPADLGWQTTALGIAPAPLRVSSTHRPLADGTISLHSGYPEPALLPERLVRAALGRAARSPGALLRAPTSGMPELQAWFAVDLAAQIGGPAPRPTARDVIVVPGSQSALSSIFRAVSGAEGCLIIESPSYWGAILAAEQAGVRLVPISTSAQGPDPEELARAFRESGARAFYAQPSFANPTGVLWAPELRRRILETVRAHGAFLIEDDWARDLTIDADPQPIAAIDEDGHVIYIRSLTKSASPSLRVAAVIARGPVRERILAERFAETMYVSGVLQAAALDVVSQPAWQTHLRALRAGLRARRDALLAALGAHVPDARVENIPRGGLNLWVRFPEDVDVAQLVRACELRGLAIADGSEWFPAEPSAPYARLGYAGPSPERFDEAARILAVALAEVRGVSS